MRQERFNRPMVGLAGGAVVPMLTLVAIYLALYSGSNFLAFLEISWIQGGLSRILSLAMLPNLGLFFAFIWSDKLKSAQGVLGITIVLAFAVIILRFV